MPEKHSVLPNLHLWARFYEPPVVVSKDIKADIVFAWFDGTGDDVLLDGRILCWSSEGSDLVSDVSGQRFDKTAQTMRMIDHNII